MGLFPHSAYNLSLYFTRSFFHETASSRLLHNLLISRMLHNSLIELYLSIDELNSKNEINAKSRYSLLKLGIMN